MFRFRSSDLAPADAALLNEVERILQSGEATGSWGPWLAIAHAAPQADTGYRSALRDRLIAVHTGVRRESASGGWPAAPFGAQLSLGRRRLLIFAAAVALLVLPVGVVVADGLIPNVIPQFITKPLGPFVTQRLPLMNVSSDDALQRLVSFPLWVPTEVPCSGPNQRWYDPARQTAGLVYQCVAIGEESADRIKRPAVDQGTLEELFINGHAALYYEDTAIQPGSTTPSTGRNLIISLGGTRVTLSMLSEHTRAGVRELQKADLIRIAASLTQVAAR
jgi:hypothetical protein